MAKEPWEMTDEELAAYIEEMKAALAQRQSIEAVRGEMGRAIHDAREGGVLPEPVAGAEWTAPEDVVETYASGDVVSYEGKIWVLERGACAGPPSPANGWVESTSVTEAAPDETETD